MPRENAVMSCPSLCFLRIRIVLRVQQKLHNLFALVALVDFAVGRLFSLRSCI